MADGTSIVGI